MSETTVTCSKCSERVPNKKFCFECGAALIPKVNQPTTCQGDKGEDKSGIPVFDSVSVEASKISNGQSTDVVNKQPTSSSSATSSRSPNEKTNGTPSSCAEAASVGSRPLDEGREQSNQTGKPVPNNGLTDASGKAAEGNVSVTEASNNVIAATNVAGGASEANEKVNVRILMHWVDKGTDI